MKIIHITASYKPAYIYGGPIQSVGKLCEALCENKEQGAKREENVLETKDQRLKTKDQVAESQVHKPKSNKIQVAEDSIQVFTTVANGKYELNVEAGKQQNVDGVPVTYFKRWTKDHSHFSPGLLTHLRSEILRCAQDDKVVVHIHAWWNLVSVLSCLVAKWYCVPVVLSPRGMLTAYTQTNRNSIAKKTIHNLFGKRLLQYCHIHATSNQEQADILEIVQPKSITVLPNLVNLAEGGERKAQSEAGDVFKLIFLSRIEEKKGLELLFEALSTVEIPWALTIAGSGAENYLKSLKQEAESLKIDDRINWVGQVSNEDKFEILANHDLLVLTSRNENFANVVIESLSVGTAVLISNKVGLASYVLSNRLGWITDLDSNTIKEAINIAYENHAERMWIRKNGPGLIEDHFNPQFLTERYLTLYQKVVSDGNRAK